jgi:homoserine dehydrogenase
LKIALIGFGIVGQSFVRILKKKQRKLLQEHSLDVKLVAISDIMKGSILEHEGLDLEKLLSVIDETGKIDSYPRGVKGLNSLETIKQSGADVIVEVTWTNLETGEPGLTHIKEALGSGKHVITSNKGPIALAQKELSEIAKKNKVQLRYESTVLSGTPAISLGKESLAAQEIIEIKGIVNGTTNYILTEMEKGGDYNDTLARAQKLGYAEANPSADVEGWDAVSKICILANTLMGADLKPKDIERKGITGISSKSIIDAKKENKRIKLIAQAWKSGYLVRAKVSPERIDINDPLANIEGVMNALTFNSENLKEITIIGRGAGGPETGSGILSDLLKIHRFESVATLRARNSRMQEQIY